VLACTTLCGKAFTVSGNIKSDKDKTLSFASILIKGSAKGTTANVEGFYSINLQPGNYTLVCQFVGYAAVEKKVTVKDKDLTINFVLAEQQYDISNVTVSANREDPAYAIIRNAIKTREEHLREIKKFQCDVYLKGQMQLRNYPKKFMGEKVDFEDGDTSKRKMLFLSESVAKYSVQEPNDVKIEIVSTKVSGNSDAYGFGNPQIVSFYQNNITLGNSLNPRGFVSPIANGALNFYKYKFEGTFYENGKEISRIKVMPKRKYEPLFTGYINIIEKEWRIHSVQLTALKEQQMQFLDTLNITQLYVPLKDKWVIKQQMIYPAGKIFSFDFFGTFLQVYDNFDLDPKFDKKFFNNTVIKYYDSSNKKSLAYWDSVRPLPLLAEEVKDYKKKDSLEQVRKDPRYLDSLDKIRNKVSVMGILVGGTTFSNQKKKSFTSFEPLMALPGYNTIEGFVLNMSPSYSRRFEGRKSLYLSPNLRYGFDNKHFNAHLTGSYNFGKKYLNTFSFSGGKRAFQLNNDQPISMSDNTVATLYWSRNYMKIYEAWFGRIGYNAGLGNGFTINATAQYQDRLPLENIPDPVRWRKIEGREFTPNYPTELMSANFTRHQATTLTLGLSWRPGVKYLELPERKIGLGSRYPTFTVAVTQGIDGLLGSDVNYTKWNFSITDNLNLKLGGQLNYRFMVGGFLNSDKVFVQDYNHIQGNRIAVAAPYLSSFQLAPYYRYSNAEKFFATGHIEYHLNGLITNKIPGFKKLNCFFVVGGNAFYVNKNNYYYEGLFSVENIFKVLRVDFVQAWMQNGNTTSGVRFSMPLFLSSPKQD
jgi:hypothetical protein